MSKYEYRSVNGKYIDPDNRMIGKVTDADFFLVHNRDAPQTARYKIESRSKSIALSLSNSTIDAAIADLKTWATNHKRVLLTYYQHRENK